MKICFQCDIEFDNSHGTCPLCKQIEENYTLKQEIKNLKIELKKEKENSNE